MADVLLNNWSVLKNNDLIRVTIWPDRKPVVARAIVGPGNSDKAPNVRIDVDGEEYRAGLHFHAFAAAPTGGKA